MNSQKKFYFFSKFTIDSESIGNCQAENWYQAVEIFSQTKNLDINDFLEIYEVTEYDN